MIPTNRFPKDNLHWPPQGHESQKIKAEDNHHCGEVKVGDVILSKNNMIGIKEREKIYVFAIELLAYQ